MSRSCLSRVAGHRNRDVDVDSKASFTLPKSLFLTSVVNTLDKSTK